MKTSKVILRHSTSSDIDELENEINEEIIKLERDEYEVVSTNHFGSESFFSMHVLMQKTRKDYREF